jgi:hypothetical protein
VSTQPSTSKLRSSERIPEVMNVQSVVSLPDVKVQEYNRPVVTAFSVTAYWANAAVTNRNKHR